MVMAIIDKNNMKIAVTVKTGTRKSRIEKVDDSNYKIQTKELPEKGKANLAVLKIVAKEFGVSPNEIKIVSGKKSSKKILILNSKNLK